MNTTAATWSSASRPTRRLPAVGWQRIYPKEWRRADLIAGSNRFTSVAGDMEDFLNQQHPTKP